MLGTIPMLTAAQIRAARALLDVKQEDLADKADVSLGTLQNIERGISDPRASTLRAIQGALEKMGVEFDNDGGLRLAKKAKR
jgi:predicted transcriptional regulator